MNGTLHALEVFYLGCDPAVRSCCTKYRSTNPRLFLNEQFNFYCNVRLIIIFTTNDCSRCQVMSYIKVRRECCWLLKSSATLTANIRGLLFELLALPPFVPFLASPAGVRSYARQRRTFPFVSPASPVVAEEAKRPRPPHTPSCVFCGRVSS